MTAETQTVPVEPTEAMLEAGYEARLNRDLKDGPSFTRSVTAP